MKVGLFVPCYVNQFFPEAAIATLSLLQKITTFAPVMLIIGIFSSYLYFYDKSLTFKPFVR